MRLHPAGEEPHGLPVRYDPELDPYVVYLESLDSAQSRRTMRSCLDLLARIAFDGATSGAKQPWWELRYRHTARIRAILRETIDEHGVPKWSPSSVNKHLVALRKVLQTSWRLGLMSAEDYHRAADLESVKAERLPHGHHVPDRNVEKALSACAADEGPAGRRDAALIAVLYSTGARRAEIAGLSLADYDAAERSLRVLGKGDKQRVVFLNVDSADLLDAWILRRGNALGALFPAINKAGRCMPRQSGNRAVLPHLSGQAVAGILAKRLAQAQAVTSTPHDFRRTFIGNMLDEGVDLVTVQQLVGHALPGTTARYDRRPERKRREAVDKLRLPGT
jgi:site-specific recombinase XerD